MKTMTKFLFAMFVMMSVACGDVEQVDPWETPCPFDESKYGSLTWFQTRDLDGNCVDQRGAKWWVAQECSAWQPNPKLNRGMCSLDEECKRVSRELHHCLQDRFSSYYSEYANSGNRY